jgi:tRNA threonylcarbamoyladenosine biosynthesis protein TsaB
LRLLAFDCCGGPVSVAAGAGGGEPPVILEAAAADTAGEVLAQLLRQAVIEAGWSFRDVEAVALTVGPGGFTGVRIGVAAGRALASCLGIGIVPVGTLEALAAIGGLHGRRVVVKDVRRNEVMLQRFARTGEAVEPPQLLAVAEAAALLRSSDEPLLGDGVGLLGAEFCGRAIAPAGEPLASRVLRLAEARLAAGALPVAGADVHPFYHRPPDARRGAGAALFPAGQRCSL